MGFFSWKTNNSDRSIANRYSDRSTFKVYMRDNKGNVWVEEDYDGYGRFGGKDYYELLAEMNGEGSDRDKGIWLQYESGRTDIIYPALFEASEGAEAEWEDYRGVAPEDCEYQGYFYEDDDDEDYY
jgi:hypothetical protein